MVPNCPRFRLKRRLPWKNRTRLSFRSSALPTKIHKFQNHWRIARKRRGVRAAGSPARRRFGARHASAERSSDGMQRRGTGDIKHRWAVAELARVRAIVHCLISRSHAQRPGDALRRVRRRFTAAHYSLLFCAWDYRNEAPLRLPNRWRYDRAHDRGPDKAVSDVRRADWNRCGPLQIVR